VKRSRKRTGAICKLHLAFVFKRLIYYYSHSIWLYQRRVWIMNKRKKRSWGLILITGVFIVNIGVVLVKQERMLRAQQRELEKIQSNIERENELNKKLLQQKQEVNTDEYIEKIARENLGMIKDGEKIFIDVD
jgi:cell division protein FtsL